MKCALELLILILHNLTFLYQYTLAVRCIHWYLHDYNTKNYCIELFIWCDINFELGTNVEERVCKRLEIPDDDVVNPSRKIVVRVTSSDPRVIIPVESSMQAIWIKDNEGNFCRLHTYTCTAAPSMYAKPIYWPDVGFHTVYIQFL